MYKKIIISTILIILYLIACYNIYTYNNQPITKTITTAIKEKNTIPTYQEKPIGYLTINKINLKEELYEKTSSLNNIEKHVTILNPSEEPSIKNSTIFIAAHSGTGYLAYFKNLNKIQINDQIILEYKNKKYTYQVNKIWETQKNGTITVPKENTNQLVLTTCSPEKDGYQLIINSILT